MDEYYELVELLFRAYLMALGYRQHNRGEWRKRRTRHKETLAPPRDAAQHERPTADSVEEATDLINQPAPPTPASEEPRPRVDTASTRPAALPRVIDKTESMARSSPAPTKPPAHSRARLPDVPAPQTVLSRGLFRVPPESQTNLRDRSPVARETWSNCGRTGRSPRPYLPPPRAAPPRMDVHQRGAAPNPLLASRGRGSGVRTPQGRG